jgi:endonuclease/exonuclease/phosphatase family metal-dependent hydrolase
LTTIRIMTYSIQRCRGVDGRSDAERTLRVIGEAAPDIVALQDVAGAELAFLAERLGMRLFGHPQDGANAFLSYYALKGVREYELGGGGRCQRADADVRGMRLHLFNLRLDSSPWRRRQQIESLIGPELLGHPSACCPTLLLGDFADCSWGLSNMRLTMLLRKARRPLWSGTYPSRFPLLGRDRAYLRGDLQILDSTIVRSPLARQASSHLPMVLTVQVTDPRSYLRVESLSRQRMEIAPG